MHSPNDSYQKIVTIVGSCHHQEHDEISEAENSYVTTKSGMDRLLISKRRGRRFILNTLNKEKPESIVIERGYLIIRDGDFGRPVNRPVDHTHHADIWGNRHNIPVKYSDLNDPLNTLPSDKEINSTRELAIAEDILMLLYKFRSICVFVGTDHVHGLVSHLSGNCVVKQRLTPDQTRNLSDFDLA